MTIPWTKMFRNVCYCALAFVFVVCTSSISVSAATLQVAKTGADNPSCGLTLSRACLTIQYTLDNRASYADYIFIGPGIYPETLTIGKSVLLNGQKRGTVTINGMHRGTVVKVSAGVTTVLAYMTITGGAVTSTVPADIAGGIANFGMLGLYQTVVQGNSIIVPQDSYTPAAAGILNEGTLFVVMGDIASNSGSGGCLTTGGILNNYGATLHMDHATVENNLASKGNACAGGPGSIIGVTDGILNNGTADVDTTLIFKNKVTNNGSLTLTRSTISYAPGDGLDVYQQPANVVNSTIANNGGIGINVVAGFSGYNGSLNLSNSTVANNGELGVLAPYLVGSIRNSILAGNVGGDCGGNILFDGYNIIQNSAGCGTVDAGHNLFGVPANLGPLRQNGGPTPTMLPRFGSPAINGGNPAGCRDFVGKLIKDDQRLLRRPGTLGGRCDIGAVEVQPDDMGR